MTEKSLIGLVGSILIATLTYVLSRWRDRQSKLINIKIDIYSDFFKELHLATFNNSDFSISTKLAEVTNKVILIGSKDVLESLSFFFIGIALKGTLNDPFKKNLNKLIFCMRKDIKFFDKFRFKDFSFNPIFSSNSNMIESKNKPKK